MAERPGNEDFEGVVAPEKSNTEGAATPGKIQQDTPGVHAVAKSALSRKTFLCLAAAYTVEGVDSQLLSTCLFALQRDIDLTLHEIAILTTAQMIFANLAAPFWGILADRQVLSRRTILSFGCIGVGSAVTVMSLVSSMLPLVFLRAMCGFFLATLKPVSIGLVADATPEQHRGKIFGQLQSFFMFGMLVTTLIGGNVANIFIARLAGWRVLFFVTGVLTYAVAAILAKCMVEPPRQTEKPDNFKTGVFRTVGQELMAVLRFLTIPSFSILVLQGIFGSIPWSIMGNNLLYFKLCGLQDWESSILTAEFTAAGMIGALLGGFVADTLARLLGQHGRPLNAQITVAIGIPLMYLQFYGVPAGQGSFWVYFAIIGSFGVFATWAGIGTNLPILSDIVPAEHRCKVMAWEGALESSTAAAIGPVIVSLLAQNLFGYHFGEDGNTDSTLDSATALGKAMAATICIPWTICLIAYSLLHWSYPRDLRRLREQRKAGEVSFESQGSLAPSV
mmetsp:Transcript_94009/g.130539  ORF Transcript_94009/g.130539 Transcript_94009/m.130539 type:complete len:505 (+) Transcript_94009:71-1585(+)|eukprot:s7981_g2.t1